MSYTAISDTVKKCGMQYLDEDMRMSIADQVTFHELDLSGRLRLLLASEKLTVGELATAAGVSKSAMEKYLAGPSSPRATALASLAANLGLSLEWLFFGYSDNDRKRMRDFAVRAIFQVMQDIKQPGPFRDEFELLEYGSRDYTTFALSVAIDRAEELGENVWSARQKAMRDYSKGIREATGEAQPIFRDDSDAT